MIMKKIISILLLLSLCFSFTACGKSEPKEISCEEIIAAYKEAGYAIKYHNHGDPIYYDDNEACHMEIYDPEDPERDYIYITRYFTAEDAEAMEKERRFNVVLWIFFGVFGEWRWLRNGAYGEVYYETFDYKMVKPLKNLMK